MKISYHQLVNLGACSEGRGRFMQQVGTYQPVDAASLVGGKNTASDLYWLFYEKTEYRDPIRLKYANKCIMAILPYMLKMFDPLEVYAAVSVVIRDSGRRTERWYTARTIFRNIWAGADNESVEEWTAGVVRQAMEGSPYFPGVCVLDEEMANKLFIEAFNELK